MSKKEDQSPQMAACAVSRRCRVTLYLVVLATKGLGGAAALGLVGVAEAALETGEEERRGEDRG